MYKICITIISILLCACASFEERCTSAGYTQGTPEFASCVADMRQRAQLAALIMAQGMQNAGQSYQSAVQQPPAYTRPVQTTCVPVGNTIQCRSY